MSDLWNIILLPQSHSIKTLSGHHLLDLAELHLSNVIVLRDVLDNLYRWPPFRYSVTAKTRVHLLFRGTVRIG